VAAHSHQVGVHQLLQRGLEFVGDLRQLAGDRMIRRQRIRLRMTGAARSRVRDVA